MTLSKALSVNVLGSLCNRGQSVAFGRQLLSVQVQELMLSSVSFAVVHFG